MKDATRLPNARTENLVIRELDDETLVYDIERDKAHCLNHVAALVWRQCDGKTTVTRVASALTKELGTTVDEDFVWLAVKQLQKFHLIDGAQTSPSVARRDLVLKYAPVALALPVILSISAPTPAGIGSCGGVGAPCGGSLPPCCPGTGGCVGSPGTCQPG